MNKIKIYTDGAASGNPGPGGYGAILEYKNHVKELSGAFRLTTNNRMELLAAIIALESITDKSLDVIVFSDSKYVVEAINQKWVFNWENKGYKKKKNPDLWRRFLKVYRNYSKTIQFKWVKGHAGHIQNERCDELAVNAYNNQELQIDKEYELLKNNDKGLFPS
tara:strand:- start:928 stop:1419 length:492 start_codon:yes stop_codon:yes gene_type:complete